MRFVTAALVALAILFFVDDLYNSGRYFTAARQVINNMIGTRL